ncbi:hypothetical protein DICVIV_02927 [Dictyocaulus viviparus]|uniref:7TM GPCR serpentine receptor class x (Srx) domain-containing protein n=1 Tax=Dictyocaulus viviparus TaxID=29172 RepID=A0A0D8Y1Z2_DICVI|nr:hypothetical protein DICVIV_02927 [Dictyocaulus viviparus]
MVCGLFVISTPFFPPFAFGLYDCIYVFNPSNLSWSSKKSSCSDFFDVLQPAITGFVLACSLTLDVVSLILIYNQRKTTLNSQVFRTEYRFLIQTLFIGVMDLCSSIIRFALGNFKGSSLWRKNITKLSDIVFSYSSLIAIGIVNENVRSEVLRYLRCRAGIQNSSITMLSKIDNDVIFTIRPHRKKAYRIH